ncbi:hypothetical protein AWC38_SpisGene17711 [Stylophora pistillata]|uniref:Uncharacterized protein n=1 Tax=Stylophora pistillata TaxID=50429 RepID=A0A2B4RNW0_STYPI|nr:hypothetical protein AWC38_SpisGene17711 [Stylophora pistillata]
MKQGFALPKKKLTVFDGDPLEYWNFIKSFETSIVNNAASESEKLMYLLQYTSGAANDTIKCCLVMDPSLGYQRARELLQERFGHPFTIASKYVTRLTEGPPLKPGDRAGLLAFADKLKDCEHTLESIGYLDEINSADNLRRIVQRLPYHLRTKFVEVADQIQQTGQRTNISHIAEFVKVKARVANNPVFGCVVDIARDRSENERRKPKSRSATLTGERVSTFNTQETKSGGRQSPPPFFKPASFMKCPSCSGDHSFARCRCFKNKTFEERLEIMKKAQLCFNCFKYGHIGVGCLAKGACEVPGCKRRHHTLLHPPSPPPAVGGSDRVADKGTQAESVAPFQSGQTYSTSAGEGKVCLRVVPVKVRSHDDASKIIETYALLDGGSDISLCDEKLAMDLGVHGRQKTFYLTTQEKTDSPRVGQVLSLVVESLDGSDRVDIVRLWTVDKLNASGRTIPSEQDPKQWPHLRDIKLPSTSEKEVRLIIGTNVPDAFWVLKEKRGNKGEPYAIRAPLGWTLMGPMHKNIGGECHLNVNFVGSAEPVGEKNDCLMHQLERFWEVENYGVVPQSKLSMSVEDKRALAVMEQSGKLEHGHYQIGLPWRKYPPVLPYNRCMAEKRLLELKGRFMQDGELLKNYKTTTEQYLTKGHASRVPLNEIQVKNKPIWYLPHHPVLNKPGKTRVVFDCAAKHKGTSLNDQLLTGPDLTNSIVGVLMRFREEQVALSADIEGGFRLTKWSCNSLEVLSTVPQSERDQPVLDLDLNKDKLPMQRTLGLHWDMESDKFLFKVALKDRPNTRRGILSLSSSVYDPLGFVAPVILPAKKLLQKLCKQKLGWDDPISAKDGEIKIGGCRGKNPLCLSHGEVSPCSLETYDCAKVGTVSCSLSHSVRSDRKRRAVYSISQSTFWSDSTCVLQYIRNQSKRFHTFVANRLSVIHENSAPHQWRYVSSEDNPADEVSRGFTMEEMSTSSKWLSGPEFLKKKDEFWPCDPTIHRSGPSDHDPEIKRETHSHSQSLTRHRSKVLSRLIQYYSSWDRLRRAVTWLLKFRTWLIERHSSRSINSTPESSLKEGSQFLSVEELQSAEREVIKHVQRLSFPEVIQAIQTIGSSKPSRRVTSELKDLKIPAHMRKLHPLLDDIGILRVGGRLQNALINYDAKHPIILPYRHQVTDLIISHHHQKVGHLAQEYVLSSLRQYYWIIKGRSAVRRVISGCF